MNVSASKKIKQYIEKLKPNQIFLTNDLIDVTNYNNIKIILYRLEKQKIIKRLMDGLYYKPDFSSLLNADIPLDIEDVVKKIAEKFNWKIVPEHNKVLNMLNLSTQVPAKYIYLSTGPYRKYNIYGFDIYFKHASEKNFVNYSYKELLVIQAIKGLGNKKYSSYSKEILQKFLTNKETKVLISKSKYQTKWVYQKLEEVYCEKFS